MLVETKTQGPDLHSALMAGDAAQATRVARHLYDRRGLGPVLNELLLAAATEVNREDPQRPAGILAVRALRRLLSDYPPADPWPAVAWGVRHVAALPKIAPGPAAFRPINYRVDLNDGLRLAVELLRIVRKSNFYKVYSILISVEDPGVLAEALYALASAVPGNRGFVVMLARVLDEAAPLLTSDQFRQLLLPLVELMNTMVQSSRYTGVLLNLTRLGHLAEFVETPPADTDQALSAPWSSLASAGELYWHMANRPWTEGDIAEVLWQRALAVPGQNGLQLALTRVVREVCSVGRSCAYFNEPNLLKSTARDLFGKSAGAPMPEPEGALLECARSLANRSWHLEVPRWLEATCKADAGAPLLISMGALIASLGDFNHQHDVAVFARLLREFRAAHISVEEGI